VHVSGYAGLGSTLQYGVTPQYTNINTLGNIGVMGQQQQPISMGWTNMGVGTNTLGLGLGQEVGPAVTLAQIPQMQQQQLGVGMVQPQLMTTGVSTAATVMPDYGLAALGSLGVNTGGVGALGAGGIALGSGATGGTSKKTTVAQPIYAQSVRNLSSHIALCLSLTGVSLSFVPCSLSLLFSLSLVVSSCIGFVLQMVVPKIITQPIQRPHLGQAKTLTSTGRRNNKPSWLSVALTALVARCFFVCCAFLFVVVSEPTDRAATIDSTANRGDPPNHSTRHPSHRHAAQSETENKHNAKQSEQPHA
jgi:hypothetical protein